MASKSNKDKVSTVAVAPPSDAVTPRWHKSAPAKLAAAYTAGNGWSVWQAYLAKRTTPPFAAQLFGDKNSALLWGLPADALDVEVTEFLLRADSVARGKTKYRAEIADQAQPWLAETADVDADLSYALACLAWAYALPALAAQLDECVWWDLLHRLAEVARDGAGFDPQQRSLVHQLVAGELAIVLAFSFPELKTSRKLAKPAASALAVGIDELVDAEGLPHVSNLGIFRSLFACWTRSRILGQSTKNGEWKKAAQSGFEWSLRATLHLSRDDRTQILSESEDRLSAAFLEAALAASGDKDDRFVAEATLSDAKKKNVSAARLESMPHPENHSEWAELAVARTSWGRRRPYFAVDYARDQTNIEFGTAGQAFAFGAWDWSLKAGGKTIEKVPSACWSEVCWATDDDGDYLELELELAAGYRLQRSFFLCREEAFLFVADSVLGENTSVSLNYQSRLPLVNDVAFEAEQETQEGFLVGKKRIARVLPLALPEWRVSSYLGRLESKDGALQLQQTGEGGSLMAPLFFDLAPGRLKKTPTWRQLTVAEDLEIVLPSQSAGFRVQVGDQQWLIYRALDDGGNRTLLGHNLTSELLIARFDRETGDAEALVEVE